MYKKKTVESQLIFLINLIFNSPVFFIKSFFLAFMNNIMIYTHIHKGDNITQFFSLKKQRI